MPGNDATRAKIRTLLAELGVGADPGPRPFVPGTTYIPASGKVIGQPEIAAMMEAALEGWLTTGRFNTAFEERLGERLGVKHVLTVNSGSSANLVAFSALTSERLGERAIRPGLLQAVRPGAPDSFTRVCQ